jgi:hypothetical protein
MSSSAAENARNALGLGSPTVPVTSKEGAPRGEITTRMKTLIDDLDKLRRMHAKIEEIKVKCNNPDDWRALMMFVGTIRSKIGDMSSRADRLYAQEFGEQFDRYYTGERGGGGQKTAEARAKKEVGVFLEAKDRMDRSWRELGDLMWVCKSIADSLDSEHHNQFSAYPDHLFGPDYKIEF